MRALALAAFSLLAAAAAPAPGPDAALRAEIASIIDLFYGHDFERAIPAAAALEARHPGHPAGPLFRAVVEYQRWTAGGQSDDGAWRSVERDLARAVALAKKMDADSPAQSHYYLGAALGFRARGLAAQRSFVGAVSDASASLKHLKKALALDPSLTDAELGLGMYHYFAARMPAAAKPFARLLIGEGGDREKGLRELWLVAESSGVARMEARSVLSMILSKNDEADWNGAEKLLAELMVRYPRNPLYRLRRTYVAERRGDWEAASSLADPDGKWLASLHPGLHEYARSWALYRAAEISLLQGRYDEAGRLLGALDERRAPKRLAELIKRRHADLDDARRGLALPENSREPAPFFSGY